MITTPRTDRASETPRKGDELCAECRIDPSREYFESDAQPPTMKP